MYEVITLTQGISLNALTPCYNYARFLEMCRKCHNYNILWSCPPYAFNPPELLARYNYAQIYGQKIVFSARAHAVYNTKDAAAAFAKTVMAAEKHKADRFVLNLEQARPNSLALYCGGCNLCESCARPNGNPCRQPRVMRYSLESLGYDVGGIMEKLWGEHLLWFNAGLPKYMFLVTALLYNK